MNDFTAVSPNTSTIEPITTRRVINGRAVRVDAITSRCFVLWVNGQRVGQFRDWDAIRGWLNAQEVA